MDDTVNARVRLKCRFLPFAVLPISVVVLPSCDASTASAKIGSRRARSGRDCRRRPDREAIRVGGMHAYEQPSQLLVRESHHDA